MNKKTKAAMIIAHPGHELRAVKFMRLHKPDVYILTDGSGSRNSSRISKSIEIIESLGAKYVGSLPPLSDADLYRHIINKDAIEIKSIQESIKKEILSSQSNIIVGDALEGFNPAHDLCRYIINSIIKDLASEGGLENINNYAIELEAPPNRYHGNKNFNGHTYLLNEEELNLKLNLAMSYSELRFETERAIASFGVDAFRTESLVKVFDLDVICGFDTPLPAYEMYGERRVRDGIYKDVICFKSHLKPIAEFLLKL